jgi:hypothetical protein
MTGRAKNSVARTKAISNNPDEALGAIGRYDSKYLKYLGGVKDTGADVLDAFRSRDITRIEQTVLSIADSLKNHIFLIGMGCVIIDREGLYADAGYSSYLEYAKHLYEKTGLSPQSFSASKTIVERYIDYNADLKKHGFNFERNSNKLLLLENALAAHENRNEVLSASAPTHSASSKIIHARPMADRRCRCPCRKLK